LPASANFRPTRAVAHNGAVALAYPIKDIRIDGDFADWPADMPRYAITRSEFGERPRDASDYRADFRVGYNEAERALYLAIEVEDESIVINRGTNRGWDSEDACEVYVQVGHGDGGVGSQYVLRGDGQAADREKLGKTRVRWWHGPGGHRYEWRFDLSGIDFKNLNSGVSISFDVVVCDRDEDGTFSWMAWGPHLGKMEKSNRRGDVLLVTDPERLGAIEGKVKREDGGGLAGIDLNIHAVENDALDVKFTSQAGGTYALSLPAGTYRIALDADKENAPRQIEIKPTKTLDLDFVLGPALGQRVQAGLGRTVKAGAGLNEGDWHALGAMDGLSGDDVRAVVQDSAGFLWVGLRGGLSRYDGSYFVNYTRADGLVGDGVNALAFDHAGDLWIGTATGLSHFDGEQFTNYTSKDGLVDDNIRALAVDEQGDLWLGTQRGLSRFDGSYFINYTRADGITGGVVENLLVDRRGSLWISTRDEGLVSFDGAGFTPFGKRDGLPDNWVTALAEDGQGHIWVGTRAGLSRYDGENFVPYGIDEGLPLLTVEALLVDSRQRVWATLHSRGAGQDLSTVASASLYFLDGARFIEAKGYQRVGGEVILSLSEDREGNVWIGSLNKLLSIKTGGFTRFRTRQGLASNSVRALFEDSKGRIWAATTGGLNLYEDGGFKSFTKEDGLPQNSLSSITEGADGDLWISMQGSGIVRYDGEHFRTYDIEDGLASNMARDLLWSSDDALWVATEAGASRFDGESFSTFNATSGLPNDPVFGMAESEGGAIWLSSYRGGMTRFDGESFVTYTTDDGLVGNNTGGFLPAGGDSLWIRYVQGGLGLFDGENFRHYTVADGLAHNHLYSLSKDRDGHLWAGTTGGVSRYDGFVFQNLLKRDGLSSNIAVDVLRDREGYVWVATGNDGITRFKPTSSPPPIYMVDVVSDVRHGPVDRVQISTVHPLVIFEYRGISFKTRPEAMRYRYRLLGHENEWQLTANERVEYADLPVGDYTFEVQAIDRDLDYSPSAARVEVSVHWPYAQWALYGGLALALMGLCWSGAQLAQRNRALSNEIREREEREKEERAVQVLRQAIWSLDSTGQTRDILGGLQGALDQLGVPHKVCGVNLVDEQVSPPAVNFYNLIDNQIWNSGQMSAGGARDVVAFWKSGEKVYRPDLLAEDIYGDKDRAGARADVENIGRRSIVDIPFSHGTLAFNSAEANAFDRYMDSLEELAQVLSEGFQRLDDLQALKERTQRAESAQREAEAANQSKSQFLANMSHEIRTPMNAILGFSEILGNLVEDGQQQHYLKSIQSSGKSLLGLINDILDLSKVEAGKLELEYAAFNAPTVFQEMEQIFAQKVEEKGIEFVVEVDPSLPKALVLDEVRLRQVLINLIGNAVKFTDAGHVKVSVHPRAEAEDRSMLNLHFSIEDTGIGIPEDQIEMIFGAFEQTAGQSNSEYGGTGLGLAITRRLIEMMEGQIGVESEVGKGSIFNVLIKDVMVASADELVEVEAGEDISGIVFEPAIILVVDDIEANRQVVSAYLEPLGLTLQEAADGREALDSVRAQKPDLILMDMRMPVMGGYEATQHIKADESLKEIPVVALTASAMKQAEEEIRSLCDGYLRKPVNRVALVSELARFLKHTRAEVVEPAVVVEAAAAVAADEPLELDAGELARLPELVQIIADENLVTQSSELVATMMLTDMEDLAARAQELGREYAYPPLAVWGGQLAEQVMMFQLDVLPQTLESFGEILNGVKECIDV